MSQHLQPKPASDSAPNFALAIHGGSGNITRSNLPPESAREARQMLSQVLAAGHAMLRDGARSLDVVEASVRALEDSPLFNAGHGACFTHDGHNELDAAIMDGRTLAAGAVAGVTTIRNPISAARAVMERSPHVLLIGAGADAFALEQGLEIVEPVYFFTQKQWDKLQKMRASEDQGFSLDAESDEIVNENSDEKFGTVGAVALDTHGDLASATSTGGMANKKYGRVGDSPLIGVGTYAANATCAVSATGHGEFFMRHVVAHDIAALIEYKGFSVVQAAEEVIMRKLSAHGGEGGVIAIGADGQIALTFNAPGMYRGAITADGQVTVAIFRD